MKSMASYHYMDLWDAGRKLISFLEVVGLLTSFLFIEFFRTTSEFLKVEKSNRHNRVTEFWNTGKCFSTLNLRISSKQEKYFVKSYGSLVTFSQEHLSSVHTKPIYTSLPTIMRGQACYVRASEANARERRRKVKGKPSYSCLFPALFSAGSLSRVLPSLD